MNPKSIAQITIFYNFSLTLYKNQEDSKIKEFTMKGIKLLMILLTCSFSPTFAQVQDNFEDNEFSSNPQWIGDDSVFTVIDDGGSLKLRSNKLLTNSTFYLATANTLVQNTQFEFNLRLAFATSGSNYVDVYLASDQNNLSAANLNAYYVRIGGTTDEISLYKQVSGVSTKIIDGTDAVVGSSSNNNFKIKVVCTASGDWTLSYDNTGLGTNYIQDGTINDQTVTTSSFFGIKITQSTASFFQKHYLDNVYVGPIILDVTPPSIVSATAISATQFDVLYSEHVNQTTVENSANYDLQPFNGVASATRDAVNFALVHYTPTLPLTNGNVNTLFVNNVADLSGNVLTSASVNFALLQADVPQEGDVIITEFFCDPSPRIGLPEIEFVEIYNKSGKVFHLDNWQLGDNSSSGTISDAWILPGEYKVLCPTSAIDSFPNAIGVSSFPSLNNSGDNIVLRDTGSVIIDSLTFTDAWYRDEVKKEGGYTIELINLNDPCSASDNWIASSATVGGTPGLINSVFSSTPDTEAPALLSTQVLPPNFLKIKFSEGMDSLSLVNSILSFTPSISVNGVYTFGAFPDSLLIEFSSNLTTSIVYSFSIQQVQDCWGNTANLTGTFIMADDAQLGDLFINEILFDPYTGGSDFVELRNNSSKVLDLFGYRLANYDDSIANFKTITSHYLIQANDYVVLSADTNFIKQNYTAASGKFIQMSLPSYNTDSSTVYLFSPAFQMDKVSYTDDWHFQLLDDTDGASLERISPTANSQDQHNWHTAAEAIGFATPGLENSQLNYGEDVGEISLSSQTFSPDMDGFEDVLQINYSMINTGMIASITIYDERGAKVKELVKSDLIGNTGFYTWDGVNDDENKASIGTYVLYFEAIDLTGKKINKKIAFVLAGK